MRAQRRESPYKIHISHITHEKKQILGERTTREEMTRGKQKIEAQRRNAEKNQKGKGSQLEARAVALKVSCTICKVYFLLLFFFFLLFLRRKTILFDSVDRPFCSLLIVAKQINRSSKLNFLFLY